MAWMTYERIITKFDSFGNMWRIEERFAAGGTADEVYEIFNNTIGRNMLPFSNTLNLLDSDNNYFSKKKKLNTYPYWNLIQGDE
jgi:hypothetical protein